MASASYNMQKFKLLLLGAIENDSDEDAMALCRMIRDKEIKITAVSDVSKLFFIPTSKYDGVCSNCEEPCLKGDAVFVRNSKPWHLSCASEEDLKHTYLKTCIRKGLVNTDINNLNARR